jgi:Sulfotransferase domain
MRLIGAGLPRTGTLSQKVALEMLGLGPCYHMVNVLGDLDLVAQWRQAYEGDPQWEQIFDGFPSTIDWPGSYYYRELVEFYPDAKVLLSVRDGQAWANSMRATIWGMFYDDILIRHLSDARAIIDPKWRAFTELMKDMWKRSGLLNGAETTDEWMINAIERFQDEVQETVPSDRLLVWSVGEGWEPLCEFLEVPVPDTPFPHLNDSKLFADRIIDGALLAFQEWRASAESESVATPT